MFKRKEKVVYLQSGQPMQADEMASALNVPFDDPQRRAVFQILNEEIDIATGLMQGKSSNHGTLGECVGSVLGLRNLKSILEEKYDLASQRLKENVQDSEKAPENTGY